MSRDNTPLKSKVFENLHLLVLAIAVLAISAYAFTFYKLPHNEDPAAWGQFGDFLGGLLNPIVSICTLVVAIAVWKLQREEMQQTRMALNEQAKTAEQQRKEQRFFDLLNLYHRTVDSISNTQRLGATSAFEVKGKRALLSARNQLFDGTMIGELTRGYLSMGDFISAPSNETTAASEWKLRTETINHYFRSVFRLLDESERLLGDEHFRYVKLLRAQLDGVEVELLALNMWLDPEGKNMLPLAEKYGLLKHLPQGPIRSLLESRFHPKVFGRKYAERHLLTQTTFTSC